MLLELLNCSLKNTAHGIMRTLLRIFSPILKLLLHITFLIIFLPWPAIQCLVKVVSIIWIWTINCLIPPTDTELMGRHRLTREGHDYLCISPPPKENIILAYYMLSAWWLNILDGIGHYVIRPGEIYQIIMMTNNITTLGYTYDKHRIKNPPDISFQISHISQLIAWILSRLSWNLAI